jgi:tight adherence protein B
MDWLLLAATFLAASSAFYAALAIQGRMMSGREVVSRRLRGSITQTSPGFFALSVPRLQSLSNRSQQVRRDLDQAGLRLKTSEYVIIRLGLGIALGFALGFLSSMAEFGATIRAFAGVAGFALGYYLPSQYVANRKTRRLVVIEDQVLQSLVSMAKSLKSGLGFSQALEYAAIESAPPLGPELKRVVQDLELGANPDAVFDELNDRIGSSDLEIATTAIVIQRRVGGNLSEILGNVSNTIRERKTIRTEVRVMTARQRLTGNLSALIPVGIAVFFFAVNPDIADLLITTPTGRISLTVGIAFELLGLWMIRRFAVVEV